MLTNDAILQRGRYRIIRCVTSVGGDCLYVAQDNVLFSEVIIHETSVDGKISTVSDHEALNEQFAETWRSLSAVDHPSILSIRGHFFEGHEHYLVTGPVEGTTVLETEPPLAKRSLGIAEHAAASMLDVLEYLREFSPSAGAVQMRPEYLWLTPDLRVAFMYFGQVNQFPDQNEFSYQPLESVWSGLDRASQNVISHSYDDHALEVLEQPSDIRSDIYSLAATLYHLSTNRKPVDALERSIEILDGKPDPLTPPKHLNPLMTDDFESFLMKSLELRREHRFESADEARLFLRQMPDSYIPEPSLAGEVGLESDLLEIPDSSEAAIRPAIFSNDIVKNGSGLSTVGRNGYEEDVKFAEVAAAAVTEPQGPDFRASINGSPGSDDFKSVVIDIEPEDTEWSGFNAYESGTNSSFIRGFFRPIPIAIVAVVAVGASAWGIFSMTASQPPIRETDVQTTAAAPVQKNDLDAVSQTLASEPDVPKSGIEPEPEPVSVENAPVNSGLPVPRNRAQIADAKPLHKNETHAPDKPAAPKPKKRMTVDDLINDK